MKTSILLFERKVKGPGGIGETIRGKARLRRVPNLVYKAGGKIHINPIEKNFSLEDLPFPETGDLLSEAYTLRGKN